MYPIPAKYSHAQHGYDDAKEASKAPEKTQAHPMAAYAVDPQLIEAQRLGQSALSAANDESNHPTRPELQHTPTILNNNKRTTHSHNHISQAI